MSNGWGGGAFHGDEEDRWADWGGDSKSSVTEGSTFDVTEFISRESGKEKLLWEFQV